VLKSLRHLKRNDLCLVLLGTYYNTFSKRHRFIIYSSHYIYIYIGVEGRQHARVGSIVVVRSRLPVWRVRSSVCRWLIRYWGGEGRWKGRGKANGRYYVYVYVCICMCVYTSVFLCMYVCMHTHTHTHTHNIYIYIYSRLRSIYIYVYIYIYIYIHTYIRT